ncbi:AlpA family phage regulatory protein [Halomonas piscis]|uniref:AlpA family phage regulatory protein n=1 Tax=Halomonas piscis TaxID=3031727 RepID=A0ABY9YXQ6_9GAMM|nr:AlpA family phage regulatory protein [Halomonas piscis]WNK19358.1 AlpA family phage regulatory protein [Halomonas piscis]
MDTNTLLSDKRLANRLGVSRATIWRWAKADQLPRPVKLSPGCTRWRLADIDQWLAELSGEVAK